MNFRYLCSMSYYNIHQKRFSIISKSLKVFLKTKTSVHVCFVLFQSLYISFILSYNTGLAYTRDIDNSISKSKSPIFNAEWLLFQYYADDGECSDTNG
jgi:hypothetical protein